MRKSQSGVTLIGWVLILGVIGVFALAAMRLIPVYTQKLEVYSVLDAVQEQFDGNRPTGQALKEAIRVKMQIKDVEIIGHKDFEVTQIKNGYEVRARYEHKVPFMFDVGLFVVVDKKVEIRR